MVVVAIPLAVTVVGTALMPAGRGGRHGEDDDRLLIEHDTVGDIGRGEA